MNNNEEILTRHDEQIKTLYKKLENLTKLTESVNTLAVSIKELAIKQDQQAERISSLEESTKFKVRTVWGCIASALAGAVVSAFLTKIGA